MRQFISLIIFAFVLTACHKEKSGDESIFYGTWIKGTNSGDTLRFYKRDGKNILAYNLSFNPLHPASTEVVFFYENDKLGYRYLNFPDASYSISSFTWNQFGQEFEIRGFELFPIMSSTQTRFTYHKL